MKIYLAYKFAGENPSVLKTELNAITRSLQAANHSVFCAFQQADLFQQHHYTTKQILDSSLPHLRSADILLAYMKSVDQSEGMLLEIGYAYALKKPIYLAIKKNVTSKFVASIAAQVIRYSSFNQLQNLLAALPPL